MYRSWIVKPLYGARECPNRAPWVHSVYAWVYFVCQIWIWNWRRWAIEHIFPDLNPNLAWVHISIWNWGEHTYIPRLESKISWSLPNMDDEQFFMLNHIIAYSLELYHLKSCAPCWLYILSFSPVQACERKHLSHSGHIAIASGLWLLFYCYCYCYCFLLLQIKIFQLSFSEVFEAEVIKSLHRALVCFCTQGKLRRRKKIKR